MYFLRLYQGIVGELDAVLLERPIAAWAAKWKPGAVVDVDIALRFFQLIQGFHVRNLVPGNIQWRHGDGVLSNSVKMLLCRSDAQKGTRMCSLQIHPHFLQALAKTT